MFIPLKYALGWLAVAMILTHTDVRTAPAQESGAIPEHAGQTISLDIEAKKFDQPLPFHEYFNLTGTIPSGVDSLTFDYGPAVQTEGVLDIGRSFGRMSTRRRTVSTSRTWVTAIRPLEANQPYLFRFVLWHFDKDSVTSHVDTLRETIRIVAVPRATLANHFDADFGVMHSGRTGYWAVVTDAHYYLVPINKNEDLSELDPISRLQRRLSVFAGLAVQEIAATRDVHSLWDGVGSPVLGVGYRGFLGLEPLRLNSGVVFYQVKPDPESEDLRKQRDLFVSMTADFDLKSIVAPLAALLH
jgi:hypothetical protein